MVTVGTGVGTALFNDGVLVPNTELGHIEVDGKIADTWASDATRDDAGAVVEGLGEAASTRTSRICTRCSGPS